MSSLGRQVAVLLVALSGAVVGARASATESPNVTIIEPAFQYRQTLQSLRSIDFKNVEFVVVEGGRHWRFPLNSGKYEHQGADAGGESVELESVNLFESSGREYAVISINWCHWSGSSSCDGIVQLVTVERNHLTLVQQFKYDSQAEGAGDSFDESSETLTIRARSADDSPHCCPKQLDIVSYKWLGNKFSQSSFDQIRIESPRR